MGRRRITSACFVPAVLALAALAAVTGVSLAEDSGQGKGWFMVRFDKDDDGKISKAEIPTPGQILARFDTNGDGFIDRKELLKARPVHGGRIFTHVEKDKDGRISRQEFPEADARFASLDTNADGFVDRDEFRKARRGTRLDGAQFMAHFDDDKDGRVSRKEFPGPDHHFAHLDANEDGFIDKDEVPRGTAPGTHKKAE